MAQIGSQNIRISGSKTVTSRGPTTISAPAGEVNIVTTSTNIFGNANINGDAAINGGILVQGEGAVAGNLNVGGEITVSSINSAAGFDGGTY